MAKKKRDDDKDEDKKEDEEESTDAKAKDGEEVAINSDILEEGLEEAPIADPADDDLDGMGTFHAAAGEDDTDEEVPDFDAMD